MPSWRYTTVTYRRPRKVPCQPEPFNIPASTTQPKSGYLSGAELLRSRVDKKQASRSSNQTKHHIAAAFSAIVLMTRQRFTEMVDAILPDSKSSNHHIAAMIK
jgi:hypothetical protein